MTTVVACVHVFAIVVVDLMLLFAPISNQENSDHKEVY